MFFAVTIALSKREYTVSVKSCNAMQTTLDSCAYFPLNRIFLHQIVEQIQIWVASALNRH